MTRSVNGSTLTRATNFSDFLSFPPFIYRYWPNNTSRMYVLENTGKILIAFPAPSFDFPFWSSCPFLLHSNLGWITQSKFRRGIRQYTWLNTGRLYDDLSRSWKPELCKSAVQILISFQIMFFLLTPFTANTITDSSIYCLSVHSSKESYGSGITQWFCRECCQWLLSRWLRGI